jgi:hypothetical protein
MQGHPPHSKKCFVLAAGVVEETQVTVAAHRGQMLAVQRKHKRWDTYAHTRTRPPSVARLRRRRDEGTGELVLMCTEGAADR